jgi:hypothetical protein
VVNVHLEEHPPTEVVSIHDGCRPVLSQFRRGQAALAIPLMREIGMPVWSLTALIASMPS